MGKSKVSTTIHNNMDWFTGALDVYIHMETALFKDLLPEFTCLSLKQHS
jgi:hypothetical protein